ncbi:MAG TPA: hypothetical protein VLH40_06515 [Atribacteraceae bacterium]|nr:hypothetical protein [Atribacteraceae bacterium]
MNLTTDHWVVRYYNRLFPILPSSTCPPAKQRLTVQEHRAGTISLESLSLFLVARSLRIGRLGKLYVVYGEEVSQEDILKELKRRTF